MGIKGLKRLISENAPDSIKEGKLDAYFGRKIAIDASMFLYSFLVAIQSGEDVFGLTDANGETTRFTSSSINYSAKNLFIYFNNVVICRAYLIVRYVY